jgi:hypothetical protein
MSATSRDTSIFSIKTRHDDGDCNEGVALAERHGNIAQATRHRQPPQRQHARGIIKLRIEHIEEQLAIGVVTAASLADGR